MDSITKAGRSRISEFPRSTNSIDFGMSTRSTATLALDVLRRVGYDDARHERPRPGYSGPIISVAADQPGDADEVSRVIQRIDPDAKPLHHDPRVPSESGPRRTPRSDIRQLGYDKAGARHDEAVSTADWRRTVEEAAGMLIAKCGLNAQAAIETIVAMASDNNRELYDVAREIVAAGHAGSL